MGRDPVADDAGADHVGDEFEFAAVPCEEHGAGAAAAIEFGDGLIFFGGEIYFVLRDAGGPEKADDFGVFFVFEAGEDCGGVLAEIAGGAGDFPLLIESAGVHFYFCADGGFVVVEAF